MLSPTLKQDVEFEWGGVVYKSVNPRFFRNVTI